MSNNNITLAVLTEQSRARRARNYAEPVTIDYDAGEFNGKPAGVAGTLVFPLPGTESAIAQDAYQFKKTFHLVEMLCGKEAAENLKATNPSANNMDALWEFIGIEFEYTDTAGIARLNAAYDRWQTVRDEQREMHDISTERQPEPEADEDAKGDDPKA